MRLIKANDWQIMSIKKDIEKINKTLCRREYVSLSVSIEIVVSFLTVVFDQWFDSQENQNIPFYTFIIGTAVAFLPLVYYFCKEGIGFIKKVRLARSGFRSVQNFVDTFDNQICYWVMICNSYNSLLKKAENDGERIFFYQEASYYRNKCIRELYKMIPVGKKVFTCDSSNCENRSTVAKHRLCCVLRLLEIEYKKSIDLVKEISNNPDIEAQNEENERLSNLEKEFKNKLGIVE